MKKRCGVMTKRPQPSLSPPLPSPITAFGCYFQMENWIRSEKRRLIVTLRWRRISDMKNLEKYGKICRLPHPNDESIYFSLSLSLFTHSLTIIRLFLQSLLFPSFLLSLSSFFYLSKERFIQSIGRRRECVVFGRHEIHQLLMDRVLQSPTLTRLSIDIFS